ncbi:MAG: trigger factor [Bacteroidales bacterium]|nr:trigger factor [Bacteroidales bacterium]
MNITKENIDKLNAILKVELNKADYEENVEKSLKEYRKRANIKGFRPGMVPIGLIRKMFGNAVKLEEINKLVSESITNYLQSENIRILGDPLPYENNMENKNFEMTEDFTFTFEVGLEPEFNIEVGKDDKVTFYEIFIDEKLRNNYIDNYARQYGKFVSADKSEENDILKGSIVSAENTENSENEVFRNDNATLAVTLIKDEDIKKLFIGLAPGDSVNFDLKKAFPNENEIAGLLNITKEKAEKADGIYKFTVSEISRFQPAEINQELFDLIYGENVVTTEEEFHKRIDEEITASLNNESNYKLKLDLKHLVMEKTSLELPEDFLKKWLLKINEKTTSEEIDKEFDSFLNDLKWKLIRNKVARDNNIKIDADEVVKEAENIARRQFYHYGLFYATDEQITKYANEMINNEEEAQRIADIILEEKALEKFKEMVTIENKQVTIEEFNKLFK